MSKETSKEKSQVTSKEANIKITPNEVFPWFQPIVDVATGLIVGYEEFALVDYE